MQRQRKEEWVYKHYNKQAQEKIISRVLSRASVTLDAAMIIHLGRQLPAASSDATREHQAGRP